MSGHLRFEGVRRLARYLDELGISTLYLSPIFRACEGSTHGYDTVDHRQVDPELGSEEDFRALAEAVRRYGMGLMLDIVPNHMGIDDPHNTWWRDVLENGQCSPYARYFDIDWSPPKAALQDKILLAILGDQFGKVLEEGQIQLVYESGRFVVRCHRRLLPTDPRSWVGILRHAQQRLIGSADQAAAEPVELAPLIVALESLPATNHGHPAAIERRQRDKDDLCHRLATLVEGSAPMRRAVDDTLAEYNGLPGDPRSFDRLEALLDEQPYRLSYWRVATDEINYRRFFDVDALAAIRVEDPEVFAAVHETLFRYVDSGWVTGLRIDHVDGLLDPQQYLKDLASRGAMAPERPYCVVEKILAYDELLPANWPVDGTTGYDFLNLLNGLFVDRPGMSSLRQIYGRFVGDVDRFSQVLYDSKRTILSTSLSSELNVLSQQLVRIAEQHRWSRDFTRPALYRALREVVACFPVYRTYVAPGTLQVGDEDRHRILAAIRLAKRRNPAMSPTFFDFIASLLLHDDPVGLAEASRHDRRAFALRFQQVTGPVTAKGLEDTAFYRYYPLASLNEVGGNPAFPPTTVDQFHVRMRDQLRDWPHTMLSSGTHDTKRGEDLRARLNVLSEIPDEWQSAIDRWQPWNAAARVELDGAAAPDANEEYLIYQTLVGTWPVEPLDDSAWQAYGARIAAYCEKAFREAKVHTSWLSPNVEYEQAVANFVRQILEDRRSRFAADLDRFVRSIADAGFVNSLAQTLVKICAPGVPDFYQGVEFWDFNLVDPDNRKSVDFAERREVLAWLTEAHRDRSANLAQELLAKWPDKRLKMLVLWRALRFRRDHPELFQGDYQPLLAAGPGKDHVVAFARVAGSSSALCVTPRLAQAALRPDSRPAGRREGAWPAADWWRATLLPVPDTASRRWRHVLSGRPLTAVLGADGQQALDLADVFEDFPVALLTSEESAV